MARLPTPLFLKLVAQMKGVMEATTVVKRMELAEAAENSLEEWVNTYEAWREQDSDS